MRIGWLPAMKITAPNSPSDRANANEQPARKAGKIAGKITLRRICQSLAPSERLASSTSEPRSSITGCTVRTTKGRLVNAIAIAMPSGV